jgi:hypothetical protein
MSSNPKFSSAPSASSLGSISPYPVWFGCAQKNWDNYARAFTVLTSSSLAMTCASPSFRVSGKCPHVTHSPLLSAHVQIPFMYCLGTLVLDQLERRGRRCRNEAGSRAKVKRAGHRAPELRSRFYFGRGMLYEQATYKVRIIRLCSPGYVQIASVRF